MQAVRGVVPQGQPQGRPFMGGGGFMPPGQMQGGPVTANPGWNPMQGQAPASPPWAAPNPGAVLGGNPVQPQGLGQVRGPMMQQPMNNVPNGNAWGHQPGFVPPGQMKKGFGY